MCSRSVLLWFVFSFVLLCSFFLGLCWRCENIFYFTKIVHPDLFFLFVLVDICVRRYVFTVTMTRKTGGHGVYSNWYET